MSLPVESLCWREHIALESSSPARTQAVGRYCFFGWPGSSHGRAAAEECDMRHLITHGHSYSEEPWNLCFCVKVVPDDKAAYSVLVCKPEKSLADKKIRKVSFIEKQLYVSSSTRLSQVYCFILSLQQPIS